MPEAIADAAVDCVARAIADVKREAERAEQLRAAEHRAFMAEQREALAEMRRAIEARLADVKDGRDGERGEKGEKGEPGIGEQGAPGRDGTNGNDGCDGADADMDALLEAARETALKAVAEIPIPPDGKDGVDGKDAYPGEAKGLYDPEASYRALDVVGFNGSEWRAKVDDPGELPGDGWMLCAQRGKPGRPGEKGERGIEGKAGKDGAQPIALSFDAEQAKFVMILDSGEQLDADIYPILKAIRGE